MICVLRPADTDTAASLKSGIGGIANRTPHPTHPKKPLGGGPQMVELSRDGRRVYFTNSLYAAWDEQFYPEGVGSWMVKLDAPPEGGIIFDKKFFLESTDYRVHQVHLEGGDASSDSYCFPCMSLGPG